MTYDVHTCGVLMFIKKSLFRLKFNKGLGEILAVKSMQYSYKGTKFGSQNLQQMTLNYL